MRRQGDNMGQAWQFGRNQTSKQELDEIKRAKAEGLTADYMAGQRWARMREAERERKRARRTASVRQVSATRVGDGRR